MHKENLHTTTIMARSAYSSNSTNQPQIVEGAIAHSDDESIDDDEAFNSEDEMRYGTFFSMSTKKQLKNKNRQDKISSGDKGKKSVGRSDDDDTSGGSSDEEASHSDDDSDENDWAGSDDSDEEDDGGQYMLDLLNKLDNKDNTNGDSNISSNKKREKSDNYNGKIQMDSIPAAESAVHFKESQFQAGALSTSSARDKLTLDSLMGGISDTKGFATVQKTMRVLSGGASGEDNGIHTKKLTTTPAPVSRVISERASRKVHYEATSKDVSQWQQVVHEQRDAETLDFRPNKKLATTRVTRDMLVEKFEAKTEFEEELAKALEVAGMEDEKIMRQKEKKRLLAEGETGKDDMFSDEDSLNNINDVGDDDDLGLNRISIEEYKKRHGELAKMRALMFYEEQKRNRINKIKSKKYRKIRKRQREREKQAQNDAESPDDPTLEKMEREEMERMKERMTLAHKNTSKWARRVLRRGAKMDIEERRALSLQIAKGDELRRKMMGEEYEEESDNDGETEEDLLKKAREILMENDEEANVASDKVKKKGLFQLAFMQRGLENQRSKAKEEARRLLEELEANAVSTDSEDESNDDEKEKHRGKPAASVAETNKVLPEGKLVASSLQFGKADGFALKVDGNIDVDDYVSAIKKAEVVNVENDQPSKVSKKNQKTRKKNKESDDNNGESYQKSNAQVETGNDENPWIMACNGSKAIKSSSLKVNINEAASMLVDDQQKIKNDLKRRRECVESKSEESQGGESSERIAELSQADLVRKAFAAPVDLEAEEEFHKEKERMKERDDPSQHSAKVVKAVAGWGNWAGAGAPPPKKPRKLPPKLQAPLKKAENVTKRKDDGMGTVIINEKRLKKTAKFLLGEIPYPYKSREEYEKALAGNLGQEWNTIQGAKEVTRPSVLVRAGKIIKPITKKAKAAPKRGPAKF